MTKYDRKSIRFRGGLGQSEILFLGCESIQELYFFIFGNYTKYVVRVVNLFPRKG